jgi:hypothetical protein
MKKSKKNRVGGSAKLVATKKHTKHVHKLGKRAAKDLSAVKG